MDITMGPVLYFRGLAAGRCHLAALLVLPSSSPPPPLLVSDGEKALPEALGRRMGLTVWRYTFSIPQSEVRVAYTIGSHAWYVYPPPDKRLRLAFTTCNGSTDDTPAFGDPERNERWRHLAAEHAKSPFHLLLQGGDQIYADRLWQEVPFLAEWRRRGRRTRRRAPFPPEVAATVADFYFRRYCRLWSQPELAPLVASIPSLMMWDDHDIFDGWGSWPQEMQQSPTYRGIWSAARENFVLFQLAARPEALPDGFGNPTGEHFGWAFTVGNVGILAPDLRSARTRTRVMDEMGWTWLTQALYGLQDCQHVLFVSTVPVANVVLRPLERLLFWLPRQQPYQDDLRDQWQSYAHREEWQRLVRLLVDFSAQTRTSVTILSGEIHLGALGCITHGRTQIFQLISSGVVHPAPPQLVAHLLNWCGRRSYAITEDMRLCMLPLPQVDSRYLAARNWLSLDSTAEAAFDVRWHAEGIHDALTKTIAGPPP